MEKRGGSDHVIVLYLNFIVFLYTVKDFIGLLFSQYFWCATYCVFIEIDSGKNAS